MKKAKPASAPVGERSQSASSAKPLAPLSEKSKSDLGNVATPRKNSAPAITDKGASKPLTKTFLSKSQDNLASTLRKKAAAAALAGNKENLKLATPTKVKTPRGPVVATPIRKAHSTQNISKEETPIKRAQSVQNISKENNGQQVATLRTHSAVKKASSTQNLTSKGGPPGRQVRISAPANIMAYNAELLASFEKEKKTLEKRISELIQLAEGRRNEIERFKFEVKNLKAQIPPDSFMEELELLRLQNKVLKERLQELGETVDPVTDSEKLSLLRDQQAAALALEEDELEGAVGGEDKNRDQAEEASSVFVTLADSEPALSVGDFSCITPEHPSSLSLDNSNWDKCSNKSSDALSEVSVACLQDRIFQMEENHYSTNEELQATLQELADLQDAVNELTMENERFADEKSVLLESLCAQTEKLANCRMQIEHLKALLMNESEGTDRSENEKQLVALLKSAQEEREELLLRQFELSNALQTVVNENKELQDIISALRDKTQLVESRNESLSNAKRALDAQVVELKEHMAKDQIDIQRFKTLLENEKQKVAELEQERNATEKSDLEALLDNVRQEKDRLEDRLTNMQEELAVSQNEIQKLREQLANLNQEVSVCKNNARTDISGLEYKLEEVGQEKDELQQEMERLRDHIDQLQQDCDRYLEEKKAHTTTVSDLEADFKAARKRQTQLEGHLRDVRDRFREEKQEWYQFQADLQKAVVIANDFKTEAQEDQEKIINENVALKEKNDKLQAEIERLHEESDRMKHKGEIRGRVLSTVDRELANLRQGFATTRPSDQRSGQQNLSVKNLIATIEDQVKSPSQPLSPTGLPLAPTFRRDSTDSTVSVTSIKSDLASKAPPLESPENPDKQLKSKRPSDVKERPSLGHRHTIANIIYESPVTDDAKVVSPSGGGKSETDSSSASKKPLTSILTNKSTLRRTSNPENEQKNDKVGYPAVHGVMSDPLAQLAKQMGGSKRNALLKWCQTKTAAYSGIDITNFSSSWNDGLAFCAILHNYLPQMIPYKELTSEDKMRNFRVAFQAAESVNVTSTLNINDMVSIERPDWQAVMSYVTSIYKHFELDAKA